MDHIYDLAGVDIDQHDIVIIPHPLERAVNRREVIGPRIIDEKARLEEQAVEEEPGLQAAVTVAAEWREIGAGAEREAVAAAEI